MLITKRLFWAACISFIALTAAPATFAGGKISIDETKWISIGAGARASFRTIEDQAPNSSDWSSDFNADFARIYVNGQIHKYIKFELNTECVFCGNDQLEEFVLLDAIAKFEFSPEFNIWAGRLLLPAERQELNGPFYSTTYDAYKTPFYSSDFSVDFGTGGDEPIHTSLPQSNDSDGLRPASSTFYVGCRTLFLTPQSSLGAQLLEHPCFTNDACESLTECKHVNILAINALISLFCFS